MSRRHEDLVLGVATAITGLSMFVKVLLGIAVHLFTVWIAYTVSGGVAAFVTLLFPVVAEMVWLVLLWSWTGAFWNLLTLACAAYLVSFVALIFSASIVAATSD
jgi:hypothetical protein